MLISVIIPAYNAADYLREAIKSALVQSYQPLEIVVVDDGSTDHTRQVCESFGDRVRYIYQQNDGTRGLGARTCAIRQARGEWIALLDQDDIWLPSKLEKQVRLIKHYSQNGIVFTGYEVIDETGKTIYRPTQIEVNGLISSKESFHLLLKGNPFCASSAILPRKLAFQYIKETSDLLTCADWDLWLAVSRHYPILVIPEVLSQYRSSTNNFSSNRRRLLLAMHRTLKKQNSDFHAGCKECVESAEIGKTKVYSMYAHCLVDKYHSLMKDKKWKRAFKYLWLAAKISPSEVYNYRRSMAVCKRAVFSMPDMITSLVQKGSLLSLLYLL